MRSRPILPALLLVASLLSGCAGLDVTREPSQALPATESSFGRSVQAQVAPHEGRSGFRLLSDSTEAFTARAGLPDGRDGGSCVFVVKADGKELSRSKPVAPGELVDLKLPVDGVKQLELVVEDAGDGNGSDWGCWFDPELQR